MATRKQSLWLRHILDESGIHDGAQVCIIAGYFGRRNAWERLEADWRSILSAHHVPLGEFHAKDLVKTHRYKDLLKELADCIARRDLFPISSGVAVPDFEELGKAERRWFTGGGGKQRKSGAPSKPYFLPFQMCVTRITHYTRPGARANFFLGCDRPFAEYALSLFKQMKESSHSPHWEEKKRLGKPSFPQAKETPQLQAADLFAHLSYLHWIKRNKENDWNVPPTGLLATCLARTKSKYDHVYINKKCFDMTLEEALGHNQTHYELKVTATS
jgi:hypothetical protein